jgi:bifunctional non-homologous end joining protein LigD
LAGI